MQPFIRLPTQILLCPVKKNSVPRRSSLTHLRQSLRPHLGALIAGTVMLAGGSAINLAFPEIIRRLINADLSRFVNEQPGVVAAGLLALFALQAIFFYFRSLLFTLVGQRVAGDLRRRLYRRLLNQPVEFFDHAKVGDLVSRLGSDAVMLQDAIGIRLSVFLRYSFQVFAGIVLMFSISSRLTAAIIIVLPVLVGIALLFARHLRRYSRLVQADLGTVTAAAEESLSGIRLIKAFNYIPYAIRRVDAEIAQLLNHGARRAQISAFFSSSVSWLMNAAIVLILLYGFRLVHSGMLSSGDLVAFLLYGMIVAVSFAFVAGGYSDFVQALGASDRIFELLDSIDTPLVDSNGSLDGVNAPLADTALSAGGSSGPLRNFRGEVRFESISFAYPSRPDVLVLNEVSFTLEAGRTTALVGPSGSGKSTIVNLLLRFYEPSGGLIRYDGLPADTIDPIQLREQCAVVFQDTQLFALSVAENLRIGKPGAADAELEAACRAASIYDFIRSLPQGFATPVGERGIQLSAGQRQRLAIARALLRNPKLLILDEATSALDSENEHIFQQALEQLRQDRTTLVIAHRLATVRAADLLIVLDGGRIVQQGRHDELSQSAGIYRRMVERQELA